jgi:hypothetical protein
MKNSFFLTLFIFILSHHLNAQSPTENCGYVPDVKYISEWKNPNSLVNKRLNFLRKYPVNELYRMRELEFKNNQFKLIQPLEIQGEDIEGENLLGSTRIIPIVVHIVRKSDKSGGISNTAIDNALNTANGFYNDFNMRFEICERRYINSDDIFNHSFNSNNESKPNSNSTFSKLNVTSRNVDRRLNIYFVPNSNTSWTWRPSTDDSRQHILMFNSQASNGTTFSHEIGHWFDLMHTHNGGNELVNGSNCSSSGDFVCDTPADPNLSDKINSSCNYTGGSNIVDANDSTYNPDTRNLLSYAGSCRNRFSEGQILRMQSALLGMQNDRGYTLISCSGVGKRVVDYKWGKGWINTEFFTVNNQTYLFLLKQKGLSGSDKTVHIHKMNSDGKVGKRVVDYKWGEGWTNTEFFTVNNQTYLFLLKQKGLSGSDKTVHIHKMNSDGKVGERVVDYKWGEGWTNTEFYTFENETYLFISKQKGLSASKKNVHIHKMNNNGKVGRRIADYKWTEGWTNTEFFKRGNNTYLFLLKQKGLSGSKKNVHIHKMK